MYEVNGWEVVIIIKFNRLRKKICKLRRKRRSSITR